MATEELELNAFQQRVLSIPESYDLFLGGGRSGGKSWAMAFLALRHAEQYGERARILYIRRSYKSLLDMEATLRDVFGKVYGGAARYNASDMVWRFPNNGVMELAQLADVSDYDKFQGKSTSLLMADEITQYPDLSLLDRMRSNLRATGKIPLRCVWAGNPGGPSHQEIAKRFVFVTSPWTPFIEEKSKRTCVYAPSTYLDNHLIDQGQYEESLRASTADDPELLKSWLSGDWTALVSGAFSECLEEKRNAVNPWQTLPDAEDGWSFLSSLDWGSAAPAYFALAAQSPGAEHEGRYYPRGSYVIFDEVCTDRPGSLTQGMNYNVDTTVSLIRAKCQQWGLSIEGLPCYADDAVYSNNGSNVGSIASELRRAGLQGLERAGKRDRKSGFVRVKNLLAAAGSLDRPGLYISRACAYWFGTVPFLSRDPKNPESVDGSGPDHAVDSTSYLCLTHDTTEQVRVTWVR
jgi:hypothetical protein